MLKRRKKYRISIDDESRLSRVASWKLSPAALWVTVVGTLLLAMLAGALIVMLTPLRQLVPGYPRTSQRAMAEEALIRVDSIRQAYERNNAYLKNILTIFDTERLPADTTSAPAIDDLTPDSLLPVSPQEVKFVREMMARERFAVSVVAPLTAEGMLFYPVCPQAMVTDESRFSTRALLVAPPGATVTALADGVVLGVSGNSITGLSIIVQHRNGFASRIGGMETLLVGEGDNLEGGQAIGETIASSAGAPKYLTVELWHNATPLVPYKYLSDSQSKAKPRQTDNFR